MELDAGALDSRFIAVDADAPLAEVLDLVGDLAPGHVVIRDDDEDQDVFYILDPAELVAADAAGASNIGEAVDAAEAAPAHAIDWSEVPRAGWSPSVSAGDAPLAPSPPTVVLTEGIPDGLLNAITEAPTTVTGGGGGGAGLDNESADGGGRPLGLAVEYSKAASLGTTLSLLIRLTGALQGPDVLPFVAKTGDVIDVVVSPRRGFVVDGRSDGQIQIADGAEPLPVQVKLKATSVGQGSVTIYAFHAGAALGALTIVPEVAPAETLPSAGQGVAHGALDERATPPEADLQFVILQERDEHDTPTLRFFLTSRDPKLGLNLKQFGPHPLENGAGVFFTDLYREIERLPVETPEQKADANERLRAMGTTLFEQCLPEDLQALLWELRDRIATIWVQSAEPYVPWELCRLEGRGADGAIVEGQFFCEAFAMTRWIPGFARFPDLHLSKIGVIVPGDSGLKSPPAEREMLHGLATDRRRVEDIPPRYRDVRAALASAAYDGLHFSGHGAFPDQANPAKAEIELEDGKKLRPTDISGVAANLGLRNPLVFLNACQAGRQAPGLTGVGGWANALLSKGAAAFIGAHWEVTDDLALEFAKTFYERLTTGVPVAEAARVARMSIRDAEDPTWLAYTVFADPGATLVAS